MLARPHHSHSFHLTFAPYVHRPVVVSTNFANLISFKGRSLDQPVDDDNLPSAATNNQPSLMMATPHSDEPPPRDKGKSRASVLNQDFTERTPLLSNSTSSSRSRSLTGDVESRLLSSRTRPPPSLLSIFFVSLSSSFALFVFLALLAYSYGSGASREAPDALLQRALVVHDPDKIDVLNISHADGLWLQVDGRVGIDAGAALGVNTDVEDGLLREIWKSIGRWGIERVNHISVNTSTVSVFSEHGHISEASLPAVTLPLTADPPDDPSWLTPISVPVLIQPTKDLGTLARFVRDSWRDGVVNVQAVVNQTIVDALGGWLHLSREHVSSTVRITRKYLLSAQFVIL